MPYYNVFLVMGNYYGNRVPILASRCYSLPIGTMSERISGIGTLNETNYMHLFSFWVYQTGTTLGTPYAGPIKYQAAASSNSSYEWPVVEIYGLL